MTGMPEASLAKEAGLAYAKISIVANWAAGKNDSEQKITVNDINSVVQGSIAKIKIIISSILMRKTVAEKSFKNGPSHPTENSTEC